MKFTKLTIEDFRGYDGMEIFLGNRITAIAGFNGTGKSTILGILANSSWLKKHKTYAGKPFRGEFGELFRASKDHDPTGCAMLLECVGPEGSKTVRFRTAWQTQEKKENGKNIKHDRFRVIPKHTGPSGKLTEAKLSSPVIYLGLSRIFPMGEAEEDSVRKRTQKWDTPEDKTWFEENYRHVLFVREELRSVSSFGFKDVKHKSGLGVSTDTYDELANSAGQDNIGQILLAVLSFRRLKRELGNDWSGGLLLIDELDATLHGATQLRLVDLLAKESKETGFQTVFTTHSPTILERLSDSCAYNPQDRPGNVEIAYLTDANRKLKLLRNPTWPQMESDLLAKSGAASEMKVSVFTEDAEAIWLARGLIERSIPTLSAKITFVDASFGKNTLMHLYVHDYLYLKNRIVLFDGDVKKEEINEVIPRTLSEEAKNIVVLPGGKSPEELLYTYLVKLDGNSVLLEDLEPYGVTIRTLESDGPLSKTYEGLDQRNRFKKWFNEHKSIFDAVGLLTHWLEDNNEEAQEFVDAFHKAYNAIAKRTSAIEVPMAKKHKSI